MRQGTYHGLTCRLARFVDIFGPCAQVDHIFSDKTGTLTQNIMKLRHWYIQGRIYDENGDGQLAQLAKVGRAKEAMVTVKCSCADRCGGRACVGAGVSFAGHWRTVARGTAAYLGVYARRVRVPHGHPVH